MSQSGPLAELTQYYEAKNYSKVAEIIAEEKNTTHAAAIFQLISAKVNAQCWLAYLKNPHLNHYIYFTELRLMLDKVMRMSTMLSQLLKKGPGRPRQVAIDKRNELSDILLAIAKNEQWCRVVSYRFLLEFAPYNPRFATYIANCAPFLQCLDHTHVVWLLKRIPRKQNEVLTTIDALLMTEEEATDWAVNVMKWLFVRHPEAQQVLLNNACFADTLEQLVIEFEEDPAFALEVLQISFLCEQWLHLKDEPYQHEKFTHKDYKCLMDFYLPIDPLLGLKYTQLFNTKAIKDLEEMRGSEASFEPMKLSDEFSWPLIVNEDVEDCADALAELVDRMSIERTKHHPH